MQTEQMMAIWKASSIVHESFVLHVHQGGSLLDQAHEIGSLWILHPFKKL